MIDHGEALKTPPTWRSDQDEYKIEQNIIAGFYEKYVAIESYLLSVPFRYGRAAFI